MDPRPDTCQAGLLGPKPQRFSITLLSEETSILRLTLQDAGNSNSTDHYFSRWRKLPFYESLFEVEETPILRDITLRAVRNPESTSHCSSSWRKLPFYESLLFEMEETPIPQSLFEMEETPILLIITL